jgi:alpha-galactosidase/6-phospho-beta-glucosidase family protein
MAMNQWALSRGSTIKTVGLCHSVPHTAAEWPLDAIWKMFDELIEAHGDWLPDYH